MRRRLAGSGPWLPVRRIPGGLRGSLVTEAIAESDVDVVRRGFEAVARRNLQAVSQVLDPDVQWHASEDEENEAGCHNRDEVLAVIRGTVEQGVSIELLEVRDLGDRVLVVLQTSGGDEEASPHGELVTVRDGKVTEMLAYSTVEDAVAGTG